MNNDQLQAIAKFVSLMSNRTERRKWFKINHKKLNMTWQELKKMIITKTPFVNLEKRARRLRERR